MLSDRGPSVGDLRSIGSTASCTVDRTGKTPATGLHESLRSLSRDTCDRAAIL